MTTPFDYATVPDNTPIIVGAGQHMEQITEDTAPPFTSPAQLATRAANSALASTGVDNVAGAIDTIAFVRLFSDSAPVWASDYGRSNNLPESVATRIGASLSHRIYSTVGGSEPLTMLTEMAFDIAQGDKAMVLLTGAEAIAFQKHGKRHQLLDDWSENFAVDLDERTYTDRIVSNEELLSGMKMPAHWYSLIENAQAQERGHDSAAHRAFMGRMMAPLSAVAAANPYAQFPRAYSPEQLATADGDNYAMTVPYNMRFVAQDAVNQSAAVLLTSAGQARALGINPQNWIFLHGFAQGSDHYLLQRPNPGRSEAMQQVLDKTLTMAGVGMDDISLIDIYSCFPCAVTAVCDGLGIDPEGERALTVTGGLPFFGGPGNNYSMHALAEMAIALRGSGTRGLITANGGQLSKHAALVLSDQFLPAHAAPLTWPQVENTVIRQQDLASLPICAAPEAGVIDSFTVIYRRGKEDIGIVLATTDAGERFLASSREPGTTHAMAQASPIGRRVTVQSADDRHSFSFENTGSQASEAAG